jgi:hypothetical protein
MDRKFFYRIETVPDDEDQDVPGFVRGVETATGVAMALSAAIGGLGHQESLEVNIEPLTTGEGE